MSEEATVRRHIADAVARPRGWRLDAIFAALSLWMIVGVAFDFRAHAHGISFAEEGFVTPSHVAFYSAFVAIAVTIGAATYANRRRGDAWIEAIPRGYRLGVLGALLFALGGPGDFLWHRTFGFEEGVEGLTSPTHLLLAVGAALFLSSPLRAAWLRRDGETASAREQFPAVVSAALVATLVTLFTLYQNPLMGPVPAPGGEAPGDAMLGILWFSAIVAATCLTLVRRFRLVPGAFTVVLGILGVLVTTVASSFEFVPAMVGTGIVADGLYRASRPAPDNGRAFRLFGAAVPFVLFSLYVATVALDRTIAWTVHVWAGAIVSAGLIGLLVSYLVVPLAGGDRSAKPDATSDPEGR